MTDTLTIPEGGVSHCPAAGSTLALFLTLSLFLPSAAAAQRVVFEGLPTQRVTISLLGEERAKLHGESAAKARVQIVEVEGRFYWASRGMVELERDVSGIYVIYSETEGAGYVKIERPGRPDGKPLQYMEHVTLTLSSITYYGASLKWVTP